MNRRKFIEIAGGTAAASLFAPDNLLSAPSSPVTIGKMAHYCNWLNGSSWPTTTTNPIKGIYDSYDESLMEEHNRELDHYGVSPLVSWWGRGNTYGGDSFLDRYLNIAPTPVKAGLLYEVMALLTPDEQGKYDFNNRDNVSKFVSDIDHLNRKYWTRYSDRFLKIDNKPVLFIWLSHAFKGPFQNAVREAKDVADFYLMGSNFNMHGVPDEPKEFLPSMDVVSAYNGTYDTYLLDLYGGPNERFVAKYTTAVNEWSDWLNRNAPSTKLVLPVSFSFDSREEITGNKPYFMTVDQATHFCNAVRSIIACANTGRDFNRNILPQINITSWNEHYEGSVIEPSRHMRRSEIPQDQYASIVKEVFSRPFEGNPEVYSPACRIIRL